MKIVNLSQAKTHLSRLVDEVASTREVVTITKAGKPMALLVPTAAEPPERRFGLLEGRIHLEDDFDDPLPDELAKPFEGDLISNDPQTAP